MSGVIWAIISSSGFNSEASWLLSIWVSLSACLLADHQLAAPLAEQVDTGRSVPWTSGVPWPELDNVRDQRARLSFHPKLWWHKWVQVRVMHACALECDPAAVRPSAHLSPELVDVTPAFIPPHLSVNTVSFFSGRIQKEHLIWLYRWRVQHLKMRVGDHPFITFSLCVHNLLIKL